MSKHTPGPWREDRFSIWGGNRAIVLLPMPTEGDAEAAANARLIAAAPEMYEILGDLVKRVSLHPQDIDDRARALLARIDGDDDA